MTMRARILGVGALVMASAAGMWLYLIWPRWYGADAVLPARLERTGDGVRPVYPGARLQLDATNVVNRTEQVAVPRLKVRSIGVVWDSSQDPHIEPLRLRNRVVYLQLKAGATTASNGETLSNPVSVSTTPVPDAFNLRVRIRYASTSAQIDVAIAGGRLPMANVQPDNGAAIILKVLPSGRHAVVGVIAAGKRIMF